MAVDIETELVQMWAGSRAVADLLTSKLAVDKGQVTIPSIGLRSGKAHQLAGLSQILEQSKSFTLELAIKTLYKSLNPSSNPGKHHNLLMLFRSLNKDIKARLSSQWKKVQGRTAEAELMSFEEFLETHRLMYEESRYLYERSGGRRIQTKDLDMAIWIVVEEVTRQQPDNILLRNLYNMLSEERGGAMGVIGSLPAQS